MKIINSTGKNVMTDKVFIDSNIWVYLFLGQYHCCHRKNCQMQFVDQRRYARRSGDGLSENQKHLFSRFHIIAMRWVTTRVFPLPGPASTRNGPSTNRTACCCGSFKPSRRCEGILCFTEGYYRRKSGAALAPR